LAGAGITLPPYYRPTLSMTNNNAFLPGTGELGDDEMRISYHRQCANAAYAPPGGHRDHGRAWQGAQSGLAAECVEIAEGSEKVDAWLDADTLDALKLRRPLPDVALRIVASGEGGQVARGCLGGLGRLQTYERPGASVTRVRRNSARVAPFRGMIAIAITAEAYEAIKATLPAAAARSVGPDGEMRIWLDHDVVDGLRALRRPGESYSGVILRLAKGDGGKE
jgi:hypothetical protein